MYAGDEFYDINEVEFESHELGELIDKIEEDFNVKIPGYFHEEIDDENQAIIQTLADGIMRQKHSNKIFSKEDFKNEVCELIDFYYPLLRKKL